MFSSNGLRQFVFCLCLVVPPQLCLGHSASESYLHLQADQQRLHVRWEIPVRDLSLALPLDVDGDRIVTWGELKQQQLRVFEFTQSQLQVRMADGVCTDSGVRQLRLNRHGGEAFAVLNRWLDCPIASAAIHIDYQLFFDVDRQHRAFVRLTRERQERSVVLSPLKHSVRFQLSTNGAWSQMVYYLWEGVHHILIGYDHIVFLLSLLLTAALIRRSEHGGRAVGNMKLVMIRVAAIVTAFTVAHSITLSVGVLGWVALPERPIEILIALSVVVAALNNVWEIFGCRTWLIAFLFGLIHGFGFAGALSELGLTSSSRALSLLGFNLGVELGQLAIVAIVMPLLYGMSNRNWYSARLVPMASFAMAGLGVSWALERSW